MSKVAKFQLEDEPLLRRALWSIAEPARRHRCSLCEEVFECHLCGLDDLQTHPLHHAMASDVYCEPCIERHELFVVVTNDSAFGHARTTTGRTRVHIRPFGSHIIFYDHLTGQCLGRGALRRG